MNPILPLKKLKLKNLPRPRTITIWQGLISITRLSYLKPHILNN